jgi:chemotaxis protein histidine kinase CheA
LFVNSELGRGTEFIIELPLQQSSWHQVAVKDSRKGRYKLTLLNLH